MLLNKINNPQNIHQKSIFVSMKFFLRFFLLTALILSPCSILPLGAKAELKFKLEKTINKVILTDISGLTWEQNIKN